MSYNIIPLQDIIEELGKDCAKEILSGFSCPLNKDVEYFLLHKAIEFNRQGLSMTHLVFDQYKGEDRLVAYFTLAQKFISCSQVFLPRAMKDRIKRFAPLVNGYYTIPAVLLAQMGKNFTDGLDKLISGEDLLSLALDVVGIVHTLIGGRIIFVECEDVRALRSFYEINGFIYSNKRALDGDETNLKGEHLLQYIRWI